MITKKELNSPVFNRTRRNSQELFRLYNEQVQKNQQLKHQLQKSIQSVLLQSQQKFHPIQYSKLSQSKVQSIVPKLARLLDQNALLEKQIKRKQTRDQINQKFKNLTQNESISQVDEDEKPLFQIQSSEYFENKRLNESKTETQLWNQVRNLWDCKISNFKNKALKTSHSVTQTNKAPSRLTYCEQFLDDLNKKVVMTKVRLQQVAQAEKISQIKQQKVLSQNIQEKLSQCQNNISCSIEEISDIKTMSNEQDKIKELQQLLEKKDQQIQQLKLKIIALEHKVEKMQKDHSLLLKNNYDDCSLIDKNKQNTLSSPKPKNLLQIVTDQNQLQNIDNNGFTNQASPSAQTSILIKDLSPKLSPDDPVFKIPCLSPTMLQMKFIEKIQGERRQRYREMMKDVTRNKFLSSEVQNMAAGISSVVNQEMLQNAQNPLKNKFIRKPMSPAFSSLYTSPKNAQKLQNKEANQSNLSQKLQNFDAVLKTLNVPYFSSKKKQ